MFTAPDPGLVRLRVSLRAVVTVAIAVAAAAAAGFPLPAVLIGGLAAMLAMFTVVDPTVGGQARTTALLPAVGVPALAVATLLHDEPLLRDALWLLVILAGVAARSRGPRGNALGIFAFMMFFCVQFLHAVPAQLPELIGATTLALTVAAALRFGPLCIERRTPLPAVPVHYGGGLGATALRQAVQATFACGLAMTVGQLVSHERWYWAVGAAWWIFVNTASRGETLVRGFRRLVGTVAGIGAGLLVALPLHGAAVPTAALAAVCVFGIFYTAAPSYSWMMFFVTVLVGLLYGLLGLLHPGLLVLRLSETAVGAACAAATVVLVLPVTTNRATDRWIRQALHALHLCTAESARRLAGDRDADPAPEAAELNLLLGRVRMALAPLVHPLNPFRARKSRAREILLLLDDCAAEARALAALAAGAQSAGDPRLVDACRSVEQALATLVGALPPGPGAPAADATGHQPAAEQALEHLHRMEQALGKLAAPLRTAAHSAPASA